jgi:ligand-binding SRPBCC domain-containing protein
MTTLRNEITIDAPMDKIWASLANIEELGNYDPTVKKVVPLTSMRSGPGAARKVVMKDGKNWFEEKVTRWAPNEALMYELTACSFPVHELSHLYSFERGARGIKVKQVMVYRVKFGWVGRIMDRLVIRKQSDVGIKKFMAGLKEYAEGVKK